jgi:hypothetical protein
LFELARREPQISEAVTARRRFRRRRGANLRYTAPRFDNRTIKAQARAPLQDAVNATRWALYEALADTGWTVEASSCGRTKYNRARLSIVKTHVFDAAWVGEVGTLVGWQIPSTEKKASAGGDYCRTKLNPHGLPCGYCMGSKSVRGFKTGDLVRAEVPKSKQPAIQVERVAIGASGSLTVARPAQSTPTTANFSIARTGYAWWPALPAPAEAGGLHRGRFG